MAKLTMDEWMELTDKMYNICLDYLEECSELCKHAEDVSQSMHLFVIMLASPAKIVSSQAPGVWKEIKESLIRIISKMPEDSFDKDELLESIHRFFPDDTDAVNHLAAEMYKTKAE